jgi:hypothetical protein
VGTVLVLAIAVGVGVLVYRLTAGGEQRSGIVEPSSSGSGSGSAEEGGWSGEGRRAPSAPSPSLEAPQGYIPVSSGGPSWHARLGGVMGLVIAVAVGAIALALSLWALGSFISRLFSDAGGGPNA